MEKINLRGYKRSSLSKCVIFRPYDFLCSCSIPKSVSHGRWIYTVLVARAVLDGQRGHGHCVSWAWMRVEEMVHSAAASHVTWASVLTWDSVYPAKWLWNKSKKIPSFLFGIFFPTKGKGFSKGFLLLLSSIIVQSHRDAISSTAQSCCLQNLLGQFFPRDSVHCMMSLLFCITWSSKNFTYKGNTLSVIAIMGQGPESVY